MKRKMINLASEAQERFLEIGVKVEISQIKAAFFEGQIHFVADKAQNSNRNLYPCIPALSEVEVFPQIRQVPTMKMFVLNEQHHVYLSRTEWVYVEVEGGKDFALVTDVTYRDMLKQKRGEKQPCAKV